MLRSIISRIVFVLAFVAAAVSAGAPAAGAQTKRALLIGIDRYAYPESLATWRPRAAKAIDAWRQQAEATAKSSGKAVSSGVSAATADARETVPSLEGAVNDAVAMQQLLMSRYGFLPGDIRVMKNAEATRDGILAALRRLEQESKPGDVVVVYYAGHGSQRVNSLMDRQGKLNNLEQTLVPADANAGQFDLRSIDINPAFNAILDKGAALTLIFDSCHSGAVTRSPMVQVGVRWAAADPRDALDPRDPVAPDSKGAIVFAAAQDFQLAKEFRDADGTLHGAFTAALISTLRRAPHAAASRVFAGVRARLLEYDMSQVPILRIGQGKDRPLFSREQVVDDGRVFVPVQRVEGDSVLLLGGAALGIAPGTKLVFEDAEKRRPRVGLALTRVTGLGTSQAVVTEGTARALQPGDMLTITEWVAPGRPLLRVWMPAAMEESRVSAAHRGLAPLRQSASLEWVTDPTLLPDDGRPLYWVRHEADGWKLQGPMGAAVKLSELTPDAVERAIAGLQSARAANVSAPGAAQAALGTDGKPRLFVSLPPSPDVREHLGVGPGTDHAAIVISPSLAEADYILTGRLEGDGPVELSWLRPNARESMSDLSSLPARTTWHEQLGVTVGGDRPTAEALRRSAVALARINGWLMLEAPPGSASSFPYRLSLRNRATGELKTSGLTREGEIYDLVLQRDSGVVAESVKQRWVYVLAMDSYGGGGLLWSSSNRVPPDSAGTKVARETFVLTTPQDTIQIQCPYGVDTFMMLATAEPLDESLFRFEAVRSSNTRGPGDALADLLESPNAVTRSPGSNRRVPPNWTLQRITLRSVGPDGTSSNRSCDM